MPSPQLNEYMKLKLKGEAKARHANKRVISLEKYLNHIMG